MNDEDIQFYRRAIKAATSSGIPFALGGAFALRSYTGITRETKDIDVFCTGEDFPHMMSHFEREGFRTDVLEPHWLGKAFLGDRFADIIFGSPTSHGPAVKPDWIERAPVAEVCGERVKVLAPEELVYSKAYVQERDRYDGADINHLILKAGRDLDWQRLLDHMDGHWDLLFSWLLNFMFVYPTQRDVVPEWVVDELSRRTKAALHAACNGQNICRGTLLSRDQYDVDIREWGFRRGR